MILRNAKLHLQSCTSCQLPARLYSHWHVQAECASAPKGPDPDLLAITRRMADIRHTILVLSGKGGVGKSTFAAQLAFALARQDKQASHFPECVMCVM